MQQTTVERNMIQRIIIQILDRPQTAPFSTIRYRPAKAKTHIELETDLRHFPSLVEAHSPLVCEFLRDRKAISMPVAAVALHQEREREKTS